MATHAPLHSVDDAIHALRADPANRDLIRDAYLGPDVSESAARFLESAEFAGVRRLMGNLLQGATVLDVGAGTGIASAAMLATGAARAIALEPDPSDEVGRGAIERLGPPAGLEILDGWGEEIDLPNGSIDIVYCRQALHHAADLTLMARECARVLRSDGLFIACREHVVDSSRQLEQFRAAHPIHRLVGGENAFSLDAYLTAISGAGLAIQQVIGPWESVINAFPMARSDDELSRLPKTLLAQRLGPLGFMASAPLSDWLARRWLARPRPGRLYSFVAIKRP